jgi:hypothetical protein
MTLPFHDPDPAEVEEIKRRLQDGPEPDAVVGLYRRYLDDYERRLTVRRQLLDLGRRFKVSECGL